METDVEFFAMSVILQEPRVTRMQALEIAKRAEEILKTRFGATRVIVFGSARGDAPWHEGSDLDLAVEGLPQENFWGAYSAMIDLMPSNLDFDLVELDKAPPELAKRITGEITMPENPLLALKNILPDQLKSLEHIVDEMEQEYSQIATFPSRLDMRGLASYVHDFYQAIESLFERVAVYYDGGVPKGGDWHTQLLMQMYQEMPENRPALLTDDSLYLRLEDYRKFRHVFRMAYRLELDWEKLEPKIVNMRSTFEMLRAQMDLFFAALEHMAQNEA